MPWDQELELTYLCFFLESKSVLEMILREDFDISQIYIQYIIEF